MFILPSSLSEKQLAEMWSGAPISDRESFISKL